MERMELQAGESKASEQVSRTTIAKYRQLMNMSLAKLLRNITNTRVLSATVPGSTPEQIYKATKEYRRT